MLHKITLGQGPALVLLHGWGWHSGIWQSLLPQLTTKYQVTLIDLPGFGLSPPMDIDNYTLTNVVELLLAAAPDRAHWLGWSLGGLLATAVAINAPQRVQSIINVTSSPCFIQNDNWPGMKNATLQNFAELLAQDFQKTLRDFLVLQLHGTANSRPLFRQLQANVLQQHIPTISTLAASLVLLRQHDLRDVLEQLKCPCFYIFGRLDALVPVGVLTHLKQLLPHAQFATIDHASHMPFLSHPNEFLQLLHNFIIDPNS